MDWLAFLFASSSLALDGEPIFLGTLVNHLNNWDTILFITMKQLVVMRSSETVRPACKEVNIKPSICGSKFVKKSQWFADNTSRSG